MGRSIPTILMLNQTSIQIDIEWLRLGVRDCLVYPGEFHEILPAIYRLVGQEMDGPDYEQLAKGLDKINRDLEQRLKETDMLFKINRSVSSLLDLDAILNRVTEAAVFITGAEEGYLLLLDEETGELHLRAAQNLGEKQARGFSLPVVDSIAGSVVLSGKPLLLGSNDEQGLKIKTGYLVKALINVPLKVDRRVIGVLGVDNQISSVSFTETQLSQMSALADIAAIALENARQYTEVRQRLTRQIREFATLQAIAGQLGAVTDFDMRARLALSLILNTVNAEAGVLAWATGEYRTSPRYISQGTLGELIFTDHVPTHWWNDQSLQNVIRTGQPVLRNNFSLNGSGLKLTRSQLAVPMRRGKQVIGAINLESSSPHIFTQSDLHFASSVAHQVAIALEGTLLQEQAETNREYLTMLMSAVDDVIWLVDTNLKVTNQNKAAGEITGYSSAEVVGRSVYDLLPTDDLGQKLGQLFNQAIQERRPIMVDQETLSGAKQNPPIFAGGKVTPIIRSDQVVGAFGVFRKPTADKGDKYIRLEFANMASHLLRTPLSFIQTAIDLMMNSEMNIEEQRIMLDRMGERSQYLADFTDELLEMFRLETKDIHTYIEPVSLLPLIEQVLNLIRYEATRHQFNLVVPDALPPIAADTIKTELIVYNLLTNAVSRCPDGGYIIIELKVVPPEMLISITDNGAYIPDKLLDRIFGQFYPVNDENGKMPSTYQLGLYTTKRLVELQHGRIWVNNLPDPDRGSRFSFALPLWENVQ
ncbi:MAG: GAF domain-containing protein [Anaerolineae bacterium]|nr:GAF domain-containing protein [Anaerolineae bacterium]